MSDHVLVLSPHPDDDAIGCGGTLRQHVLDGANVKLIVLTSGEAGGHGRQSREETAKLREAEARAAAEILGLHQVEFWREPDGAVKATEALVTRLQETIETWQPTYIYAPHPGEKHADHQATAELLLKSLATIPNADAEHATRLYEVWTPMQDMDEIVDISDFVQLKAAAIRVHKTQVDVMRLDEAALALNRYRGEMHCWPGGDYAEVFQRVRL